MFDSVVVDANGFIKNIQFQNIAHDVYTIEEVIREIKDHETKIRLKTVPYKIKFREPSSEAILAVKNFVKLSGDFRSLSRVDIKLIALVYHLEVESRGSSHLRLEPTGKPQIVVGGQEPAKSESPEDSENEDWITPGNFGTKFETPTVKSDPSVVCFSTDFAVQNVVIQMGLSIISADGMLIKTARSYVLRCFLCQEIVTDHTKQFCPSCGHKTLRKTTAQVEADGSLKLFFAKDKHFSLKKYQREVPRPKGGKHSRDPIVAEFQRVPHQFVPMKYRKNNDLDGIDFSEPFAKRDLCSRARVVRSRNVANF